MFRAAVDPKKKSSEMRAWRILPANARNDHRPKTNANCPCVRPHSRESALCSKFLVLLFLLLGLLHGFVGSFVSVILCVKERKGCSGRRQAGCDALCPSEYRPLLETIMAQPFSGFPASPSSPAELMQIDGSRIHVSVPPTRRFSVRHRHSPTPDCPVLVGRKTT